MSHTRLASDACCSGVVAFSEDRYNILIAERHFSGFPSESLDDVKQLQAASSQKWWFDLEGNICVGYLQESL